MTQQEVHNLIREHGGIVHGDGNIFFTNAVQFGLAVTAMQPEPSQEYAHMQMAARAEAARVDELDSCRKQDEALIAEHAQALSFLCGLHTCLTIDGPPMAVAERIFDAVLAERTDMLDQIKRMERNLETMRQHKRTTP